MLRAPVKKSILLEVTTSFPNTTLKDKGWWIDKLARTQDDEHLEINQIQVNLMKKKG